MSASRSPTWTHRGGSPSCARGPGEVLHPPDALLLLDRDAGEVDAVPQAPGALELLAGPELDRRQAEWDAAGRQHQAGVHQQPADGVGGAPGLDAAEWPIAAGRVPLEAELGRVVEHQDRARGGGEAGGRGREVPGQDDALIDPGVAEEPVRGLGRGPILARGRDRAADPPAQVAEQLPEPGLQPLVREPHPSNSRSTQTSMSVPPTTHTPGPQAARRARE